MASDSGRGSQLARGILIEWLSAVWMVIEAIAAVLAGVLARSVALVAFGADSVIELVAGGALLYRPYVEANEGGSERVELGEQTQSMVIRVMTFEGCPNCAAALDLVEKTVRDLRLATDIEAIQIDNENEAKQYHFLGSPTIQVD